MLLAVLILAFLLVLAMFVISIKRLRERAISGTSPEDSYFNAIALLLLLFLFKTITSFTKTKTIQTNPETSDIASVENKSFKGRSVRIFVTAVVLVFLAFGSIVVTQWLGPLMRTLGIFIVIVAVIVALIIRKRSMKA